jgi:hypothetical protein
MATVWLVRTYMHVSRTHCVSVKVSADSVTQACSTLVAPVCLHAHHISETFCFEVLQSVKWSACAEFGPSAFFNLTGPASNAEPRRM